MFDCIVVGGGPAGMMAAVTAARGGLRVLILEKNGKLGKKLLITGKGRCNVTNDCTAREVLQNIPRNSRFLYSAMAAFPPDRAKEFFENYGCPLKTERGNRVFPQSDRSQSVLTALQNALREARVTVRGECVTEICSRDGKVVGVRTRASFYETPAVILATGGLSYPATGSTGDGYRLAKALGHTVEPLTGSLVPLEIAGEDCPAMQGLSLRNVGVRLTDENGKIVYQDFGEMLFTHFGVSGPTVLSASCHLGDRKRCALVLDLKPALDEGKLNARVLRDLMQYRNRSMVNALTDLLPWSMIPVVLRKAGISPDLQANALTRQKRQELVILLKNFSLQVIGKRPVEEAIITSGGICVSEVNPRTMESRLVSGLYFAGEILDCDAYTGGFNLQIAWATGVAAGAGVAITE